MTDDLTHMARDLGSAERAAQIMRREVFRYSPRRARGRTLEARHYCGIARLAIRTARALARAGLEDRARLHVERARLNVRAARAADRTPFDELV